MNENGAFVSVPLAVEPEAGVEGDAAAALVGAPKPNVGLEGWLAGVLVAPNVGVDVE